MHRQPARSETSLSGSRCTRERRPKVLQFDPGSLPEIFRSVLDQDDPRKRGNDEEQKPDKQPESAHSLNSHTLSEGASRPLSCSSGREIFRIANSKRYEGKTRHGNKLSVATHPSNSTRAVPSFLLLGRSEWRICASRMRHAQHLCNLAPFFLLGNVG